MNIIPTFTQNIFNQFQAGNSNNNVSSPKFGVKCSNLAPLSKDTVSFTSGKKEAGNPSDGINKKTALLIYNEANQAYKYLDRQLDRILSDLVRPEQGTGSKTKPIKEIRKRIKDPDSICEKSATRKLTNYDEVKSEMTDIVGARIVMADSSREAVDKVIERFTDAVNNNRIKIIEIENYRPEPEMDDYGVVTKSYDYSSALALKNLKKACDNKNDTSIKKSDEDQPSGYMAIHLLVQLPNGFTGEIQIIGPEVERLKDVEDMCFKVKNGKHLKPKYASVEKQLKPIGNKEDEILRKEYGKYTRRAYKYQRDMELNPPKNKKNKDFLHIPDYLPSSLDFNNIADEIEKCNSKG